MDCKSSKLVDVANSVTIISRTFNMINMYFVYRPVCYAFCSYHLLLLILTQRRGNEMSHSEVIQWVVHQIYNDRIFFVCVS